MEKNTLVISAFPGTGKTHFTRRHAATCLKILDSDSSGFSWMTVDSGCHFRDTVRNPEFPANYIGHIKQYIGSADIIFVSSHKEVRDALLKEGIPFVVACPKVELLEEYVARFERRGSDHEFIQTVVVNWKKWISEICDDMRLFLFTLDAGEYVGDVVHRMRPNLSRIIEYGTIGDFLVKNGFTRTHDKPVGAIDEYENAKCKVTIDSEGIYLFFKSEDAPEGGTMHQNGHIIYGLVGMLTWYGLIDKNYLQ